VIPYIAITTLHTRLDVAVKGGAKCSSKKTATCGAGFSFKGGVGSLRPSMRQHQLQR